jgi:hypothetical protein
MTMARALPVLGLDPDNSIQANAALIIPVRVAELLAWEPFIHDPARVTELHQMRIAAKRLRYTMELFAPFYGPEFTEAIHQIKAIQDQLGNIHDADVLVPELRDHLQKVLEPPKKNRATAGVYGVDCESAAGLLALCRRKRQDREDLYGRFLATWSRLRAQGFFESLRQRVREEALKQSEAMRAGAGETAAPETRPADKQSIEYPGGRNGRRKTPRKPTNGHQHSRRVSRDDTRPGDHPGTGVEEGGMEQHSLFEEGDPR